MKQFAAFLLLLCCANTADAQSFLNHLKQKKQGEGTVTVAQSAAIDELVNGTKTKTTEAPTAPPKVSTEAKSHSSETAATTPEPKRATTTEPKRTTEPPTASTSANETESESEAPAVDMSKKVMRGSYKVNGYRVQAFAGGNSRADKQKAEQAGRDIKMKYPDLPIYVHFYSPQWKCRVGNFRSYEEANRVLKGIRAMGYKQACIVKGKISVQN